MNRRGFLGNIGLGAAAIVVAPIAARLIDWDAIPAPPPLPVPKASVNHSFVWYTGYDSFDPPTSAEVLDAAGYQWKRLGGFVSIPANHRMSKVSAAVQQYLDLSV